MFGLDWIGSWEGSRVVWAGFNLDLKLFTGLDVLGMLFQN